MSKLEDIDQSKRRGGKPRAPHRECTEKSVLARMTECAGMRYQSSTLALYFKVPTVEMTELLRRMAKKGEIRSVRESSRALFYFPSDGELAKEASLRNKEQSRAGWRSSATLNIWRPDDPEVTNYGLQLPSTAHCV